MINKYKSFVSVVVPNYNHAAYLRQRLDSIVRQTYRNFEVILLDDHSPDESVSILDEYQRRFERVQVCYNEMNGGSPFAQWIRGIDLAAGEYIWIAESDDWASDTFLERMVEILDGNAEVGVVYCQSWVADEQGSVIRSNLDWTSDLHPARWSEDFVADGRSEVDLYMWQKCTIPNASAVVFRKTAYRAVGGVDPFYRLCGDYLLWCRIVAWGKVGYVAEHLNYFRTHAKTQRDRLGSSDEPLLEFLRVYARLRSDGVLSRRTYHRAVRNRMGWIVFCLGRGDEAIRKVVLQHVYACGFLMVCEVNVRRFIKKIGALAHWLRYSGRLRLWRGVRGWYCSAGWRYRKPQKGSRDMGRQFMNVVYCLDSGAAIPFAISLNSFIKNGSPSDTDLWVVDCGLSSVRWIQRLAGAFHSFHIIPLNMAMLRNVPVFGHVSAAAYARILLPELLPSRLDKVLYLDADTFINGRLSALGSFDLQFAVAAAQTGTFGALSPRMARRVNRFDAPYFNSGVMLMNLKKWRENSMAKKVLAAVGLYRDELLWWDQDALNIVLENDWSDIPVGWNTVVDAGTCSPEKLGEYISDKSVNIIHFAGSLKPWHYSIWGKWRDDLMPLLRDSPYSHWLPLMHVSNKISDKMEKYKAGQYILWQLRKLRAFGLRLQISP